MNPIIGKISSLIKDLSEDELLHLMDILDEELQSRTSQESQTDEASFSRIYMPRMNKLMEWGAVRVGDSLYVLGHKAEFALVANHKEVVYKGKNMKYQTWAKLVTGWKSVNIYASVMLEREGRLLWEARRDAMIANGVHYPEENE